MPIRHALASACHRAIYLARKFPLCLGAQLLPSRCLLCHSLLDTSAKATRQPGPLGLCRYCEQSLPRLTSPYCTSCALPLAAPARFCGQCLQQPPKFVRTHIPFVYQHPLDKLIQQFKYQQQLAQGRTLGELMARFVRAARDTGELQAPELLMAVPLHWRKRWIRGFNQAEGLAQQLSQALDIPLIDALERCQHSHSQKGLDRRARLRNLRQAFRLKAHMSAQIQGRHIALVDDVVTTGATARRLSELLSKAGAQQIDIWALARTPAPSHH